MMDNQSQISPQSAAPSQVPISPKHTGKTWGIIGTILVSAIVIFSIVIWYGSRRVERQDKNVSNNSQKNNTMSTLTAEKIRSLKVASNVGNDYFIGSPADQNVIVDMFVKDNSASDSTYLYLAANTARLLNRPKEAMFLFFAAQLRKSFDYQRFELDKADGNNIQTYLEYLNNGAGQGINPLAIQNPQLFSEAVRMIEEWNVVPADDADYSQEIYGEAKLTKDEWPVAAQAKKDSFLTDFAYKQEELFSDSKALEAMRFVQDYNFGKIPRNSINDQKYEEYLNVVHAMME